MTTRGADFMVTAPSRRRARVWSVTRIHGDPGTFDDAFLRSIDHTAAGALYLAWYDATNLLYKVGVSLDGGTTWDFPTGITSVFSSDQYSPGAALIRDGKLHLYAARISGAGTFRIVRWTYDGAGGGWTGPTQVHEVAGNNQAALRGARQRDYTEESLSWTKGLGSGTRGIEWAPITAGGLGAVETVTQNETFTSQHGPHALFYDEAGRPIVVWRVDNEGRKKVRDPSGWPASYTTFDLADEEAVDALFLATTAGGERWDPVLFENGDAAALRYKDDTPATQFDFRFRSFIGGVWRETIQDFESLEGPDADWYLAKSLAMWDVAGGAVGVLFAGGDPPMSVHLIRWDYL